MITDNGCKYKTREHRSQCQNIANALCEKIMRGEHKINTNATGNKSVCGHETITQYLLLTNWCRKNLRGYKDPFL